MSDADLLPLFKESLPETFEGRREGMRTVLKLALEDLMEKTRKDEMLVSPFGRKSEPTPIMTEDEFLAQKDDMNDEPTFSFEYGFNPLTHLAGYLKRFHPTEVVARRKEKEACMQDLHRRAQQAQTKLREDKQKDALKAVAASGIVYGPVITPVGADEVRVLVCAAAPGHVVLELSTYAAFSKIEVTQEEEATAAANFTTTFVVKGLKPGFKYCARCSLRSEGYTELFPEPMPVLEPELEAEVAAAAAEDGAAAAAPVEATEPTEPTEPEPPTYKGRDGGVFQKAQFWGYVPDFDYAGAAKAKAEAAEAAIAAAAAGVEPPAEEAPAAEETPEGEAGGEEAAPAAVLEPEPKLPDGPQSLSVVGVYMGPFAPDVMKNETILGPSVTAEDITKEKNAPVFTAILGDVFESTHGLAIEDPQFYRDGARAFHSTHACMGPSAGALMRGSAVLMSWNDSQYGSDVGLQAEEIVFKQYQHDLKHWTRKYKDGGDKKKKSSSKNKPPKEAPPEPELQRPPQSVSLSGLSSVFPVKVESAAATRNMYSSYFASSDVHIVSLDMRRGLIGKQQSRWLREVLSKSPATWKVVLCGAPFGAAGDGALERLPSSEGQRHVSLAAEDVGDYGFPNNSLMNAMCKMQQYAVDKVTAESAAAGDSPSAPPTRPATPGETDEATATATPVSSGIVMLSGGRNNPYVATYDPLKQGGDPFLVEVCGGSALSVLETPGVPSDTPLAVMPGPEMKEGVNGDMVWTGAPNKCSVGAVKVLPSGLLQVSVTDATTGDVFFTQTFKR